MNFSSYKTPSYLCKINEYFQKSFLTELLSTLFFTFLLSFLESSNTVPEIYVIETEEIVTKANERRGDLERYCLQCKFHEYFLLIWLNL